MPLSMYNMPRKETETKKKEKKTKERKMRTEGPRID